MLFTRQTGTVSRGRGKGIGGPISPEHLWTALIRGVQSLASPDTLDPIDRIKDAEDLYYRLISLAHLARAFHRVEAAVDQAKAE